MIHESAIAPNGLPLRTKRLDPCSTHVAIVRIVLFVSLVMVLMIEGGGGGRRERGKLSKDGVGLVRE